MKTWVENLDIALTKSVRSSDDLSTYAAALLMQKAKVVGTASDKATALTTTVNFTHVMDRVVQQFREDMISVIMANAEDDHAVTEASFRMLPNQDLEITYQLRGPEVAKMRGSFSNTLSYLFNRTTISTNCLAANHFNHSRTTQTSAA